METDPLYGMTQRRWDSLTPMQREQLRDLSDLSPQLRGLEGYQVAVETFDGVTRAFWVGISTGWRPTHFEVAALSSASGTLAAKEYKSVRVIRTKP